MTKGRFLLLLDMVIALLLWFLLLRSGGKRQFSTLPLSSFYAQKIEVTDPLFLGHHAASHENYSFPLDIFMSSLQLDQDLQQDQQHQQHLHALSPLVRPNPLAIPEIVLRIGFFMNLRSLLFALRVCHQWHN